MITRPQTDSTTDETSNQAKLAEPTEKKYCPQKLVRTDSHNPQGRVLSNLCSLGTPLVEFPRRSYSTTIFDTLQLEAYLQHPDKRSLSTSSSLLAVEPFHVSFLQEKLSCATFSAFKSALSDTTLYKMGILLLCRQSETHYSIVKGTKASKSAACYAYK